MVRARGRVSATCGLVVAAVLTMSACGGVTAEESKPTASASVVAPPGTTSPAVTAAEQPVKGAADSFRAWLAASRLPDVATACAGLSPALKKRMIAELQGSVRSCPEMITTTAELFRATGTGAEVEVEVHHETASQASLFVTYLAPRKCGTVVMKRSAGEWIITEQSEGCTG